MKQAIFAIQTTHAPEPKINPLSNRRGNLLVYMVVVLLIFAVLGVSLVSLFSTSTGSSATPNDSKRARLIAESGIRYALREIRNSSDIEEAAERLNNGTKYKLGKQGSFSTSIFSPGLLSSETALKTSGQTLTLDVPFSGKFPDDFNLQDVYIVNWNDFKDTTPLDESYAAFTVSDQRENDVVLNLGDDYDAVQGDTVCFALLTTDGGTFPEGGSIYVAEEAKEFFPASNGAIRILNLSEGKRYNVFYERLEHDQPNNRVELKNLKKLPGESWQPVTALNPADYVILSPANFRVFASGESDEIAITVGLNNPIWAIGLVSDYTIYMRELLADKQINQYGDVIRTQEAGDKKIELGRGTTGTEGFGDLWYGGEKPIGGDTNYCVEGRCTFDEGIRAYFTADLTGDGEGFTFALISAGEDPPGTPVNTALSAGGDFELSELLGYAGDSRLDTGGGTFVDQYASKPPGLLPPKIALEFDTRTNLNEPLQYCQTASNLAPNSRHDPLPDNAAKDVVQHVFWGNELLTILCRGDNSLYDDNRHDAEGDDVSLNWSFDAAVPVQSSPTFDVTDETIYFGTNESPTSNFYGFKFDGTLKWQFNPGDSNVTTKPALDTVGAQRRVYFTAADNNLYAMDADPPTTAGVQIWAKSVGGIGGLSPAVDKNHNIYVGSSNDLIYAFNSDGVQLWARDLTEDIESSPTVDNTGGLFDGIIYIGRDADADPTGGKVFSFDASGTFNPNWGGTFADAFSTVDDVDSRPALSKDGSRIYAVDDKGHVYAIKASDGSQDWMTDISRSVNFIDPAVDLSGGAADGTIYIGTDSGWLYALNPADGSSRPAPWPLNFGFPVNSSPAVGPDGTIYIGTDDGIVHAINPDGTERWVGGFPTGAAVQSSPEVGIDGSVYVGSDDNNLYTVATVAMPRNYRITYANFQRGFLTSENLDSEVVVDDVNNWLNGSSTQRGPWAIRMEVERDSLTNQYVLLTWVRQCAQFDCSDVNGTLFQDTTVKYDYSPIPELPFTQTIDLTGIEDDKFERFLFGFTTAAKAGDDQLTEIRDFQLTFIRAGLDPVVNNDLDWTPP